MSRAAPGAKSRSVRRSWSLHAEQASLAMRSAVLDEAIRNFETLVNPPQQMQLAREIALTRGAELTLAYRNVVMVSAGFRRCDVDGTEDLTRQPCVIFVVRRKWKKGAEHKDQSQVLPPHLLTHATDAQGRRVLVAVPTDVQVETRYAAARAQSERAICVHATGRADEYGTLTALIRLSGDPPRIKALSPLHVLSPAYTPQNGGPAANAVVELANGLPQRPGAPVLGTSAPIGGQLVPGPDISFDAQLIDVSDMARVKHMLQGMPLSSREPYIASPERYDELTLGTSAPVLEILLPDNHPLAPGGRPRLFVRPAGTSDHAYPIPYTDGNGGIMMIQHWMVIHLQCPVGQDTIPGDSGSPVVLWLQDGTCTFVGMHFAGRGGLTHVLPAWALMYAGNYLGTLPDESQLALVA